MNVGNVAEFGFDDSGDWLAYTIDARDQIGNGVQLRNMRTDVVRAIDSDRALYRRLVWSDSLARSPCCAASSTRLTRDTLFSVVTLHQRQRRRTPKKIVFDPAAALGFPGGMKIAADRAPRFSDDFSAVFFGIQRSEEGASPATVAQARGSGVDAGGRAGDGRHAQSAARQRQRRTGRIRRSCSGTPRIRGSSRSRSCRKRQDRAFNYLSEYRFADNKFVRLVGRRAAHGQRDRPRPLRVRHRHARVRSERQLHAAAATRISTASTSRPASASC